MRSLDRERAWRKREILSLQTELSIAQGRWETTLVRSGFLLLYAHWEGFVRKAAVLCAEFVDHQVRVHEYKRAEVAPRYLSLALFRQYQTADGPSLERFVRTVSRGVVSLHDVMPDFTIKQLVTQRGTMDWLTFCSIMFSIGLEPEEATRELVRQIDVKILRPRHEMAHGGFLKQIDKADYGECSRLAIDGIETVSSMITEMSTAQGYLAS